MVLDSPDPGAHAAFYEGLLGWPRSSDEPGWVKLSPPGGGAGLSFQEELLHVRPVWPSTDDSQQMQVHLDLRVTDLAAASALAESLGAVLASFQPQEHVRVYLDPFGHPFCLFT